MKRVLFVVLAVCFSGVVSAQKDSTSSPSSDTVKVGNFIIVKKGKSSSSEKNSFWNDWNNDFDLSVIRKSSYSRRNVSTNWWIMDIGFANYRDETNYTNAQAGSYLRVIRPADGSVNEKTFKLNTGKTTNVNIWFFMQKLNVIKRVLNLKYGLGTEMYNFRYDTRLSYRKDPNAFVHNDSISFSKNKLYVGYLTVPFLVNINTTPNNNRGLSISGGVSAGYLLSSRNKQISAERGKQKTTGDFDLQTFRFAAIAEIGLGPVRLYGTYSLNKLHNNATRIEQYPYAVGVRFSNW